jgi:hypothetical protein
MTPPGGAAVVGVAHIGCGGGLQDQRLDVARQCIKSFFLRFELMPDEHQPLPAESWRLVPSGCTGERRMTPCSRSGRLSLPDVQRSGGTDSVAN